MDVLLIDIVVGCGRFGSTLVVMSASSLRLRSGGSVEVTTAVEVITAVEIVVVMRVVSKIVDVVVVVSVVSDMVVSGSTSVVSCVCCSVKKRD